MPRFAVLIVFLAPGSVVSPGCWKAGSSVLLKDFMCYSSTETVPLRTGRKVYDAKHVIPHLMEKGWTVQSCGLEGCYLMGPDRYVYGCRTVLYLVVKAGPVKHRLRRPVSVPARPPGR